MSTPSAEFFVEKNANLKFKQFFLDEFTDDSLIVNVKLVKKIIKIL